MCLPGKKAYRIWLVSTADSTVAVSDGRFLEDLDSPAYRHAREQQRSCQMLANEGWRGVLHFRAAYIRYQIRFSLRTARLFVVASRLLPLHTNGRGGRTKCRSNACSHLAFAPVYVRRSVVRFRCRLHAFVPVCAL